VVTGNDTVSVWDLTDPRGPVRARVLTRHTDGAGQVAFSPDAGIVAGAAVDGSNSITLWRLR
jgi:WD40 repeat protein